MPGFAYRTFWQRG